MAKKKKNESKLSIRPLDDRIVVQRVDAEETTTGGIVIPDSAKEKSQQATVVAVGPGKLLDSGDRATLEIEVGDTVLIGKYGGTPIKVGSDEFVILRESDVLAKLL